MKLELKSVCRETMKRRTMLQTLGVGLVGAGIGTAGVTPVAAGDEDHSDVMDLVENKTFTHEAVDSGSWSDPGIWDEGELPGDEATVQIPEDVTVTLESQLEADLQTVRVDGTLRFDPASETHLRVETLVTMLGSHLEIGTESEPIASDVSAQITILDFGDIDEDEDPERLGRGILTMGELEIHGAEKTSWDELSRAPEAGDSTIELASSPTNWNQGDEIVIPGLNPSSNEDEERTISSISGSTIELDSALEYDHVPPENNLDVELTAYALNLSRNVRFESQLKETDVEEEARINRQGHLMVMQPAQSISYLEVDHFGRTNKNFWISDEDYSGDRTEGRGTDSPDEPNIVGRYGLHFHQTGIGEDPHEVTGIVVQHSPGWGVVNHSSHANVVDSITYDVFGAGFVTEAGKERGSFERCFALRSEGSENRGRLHNDRHLQNEPPTEEVDFGHEGEGFWLQGPAVAVDDCVAAGHGGYAISLWSEPLEGGIPEALSEEDGIMPSGSGTTDPRNLLLKSFTNNTVFASHGGFDYGNHRSNDPSVVDTFTVYNIAGNVPNRHRDYPERWVYVYGEKGNCMISERYSRRLRIENPQFCNVDGDGGHGVRRNYVSRYPDGVYGGVMEGLDVGVQIALHAYGEDIDDVTFVDNGTDVVFEATDLAGGRVSGGADSVADLTIEPGTTVEFEWDAAVDSQPAAAEWEGGSGTHTFSVPGDYEYEWPDESTPGTIVVTDDDSGAQPPTAAFDHPSAATPDETVSFDASASTAPDSTLEDYEWEFGDGESATGEVADHQFGETGEYEVTLTVTDDAGESDETMASISIHEPVDEMVTVAPDGSHEFAPADLEVNAGSTVGFEWDGGGHTVTVDSQPADADWAGVDSTQDGGSVHTHTFEAEGTYEYYCELHPDSMQGTITVDDGGSDRPSTVDEDVWEAVTDQHDPTDELTEADLTDAIEAYHDDEPVDGVALSFDDVVELIRWHNR